MSPVPGGSLPGGQDPAGQLHRGGCQQGRGAGPEFLPANTTEALNALSVTQEKLRLFLDKKCQYLPFQDWSVKCKRMVDTGILVLVQLGKQVLVMQGKPPGCGFSIVWDGCLGGLQSKGCFWSLGQSI